MPGGKLRTALLSQQKAQQHHAARKRSESHSKLKAESIKQSLSGAKKGKKKAHARTESFLTARDATNDLTDPSLSAPSASRRERVSTGKGKQTSTVIPFDKEDTILLLGEANFSFALSLITQHQHPPHQLLATAYDSEETILAKYPDAATNLARLRQAGVRLGFGVDAGALEKSKVVGKGRRWSRVIFNFPHAGAGITDQDRNILTNQHLLLRTLRSVPSILSTGPPIDATASHSIPKRSLSSSRSPSPSFDMPMPDSPPPDPSNAHLPRHGPQPPHRPGTLLVTLLTSPPYSLWSLPSLAKRPPPFCPGTRHPQPRWKVVRSFEFHPEAYPGYEHRRTIGWKEGVSKGGNEEIMPVRLTRPGRPAEKDEGGQRRKHEATDRGRVARTWELEPLPLDARGEAGEDDSDD